MRGSLIPTLKRLTNRTAPIDPSDMSEANANNYMFLFDNLATGDYLQDSSIIARHMASLRAREKASPNLTLEVLSGVAWFAQNSNIIFAGGDSPSFAAPATNPRIDVLTLRSDGVLYVIGGTEAASPAVPTIPSTDIPIAQVYNVVGQTRIRDNDSQEVGQGYVQYDLRPFVQVAVGSSAMPKLGLVARVQLSSSAAASADTGYVNVVNYTGSGRLRAVHWDSSGSGDSTFTRYMRIIIDGTTFLDITEVSPAVPGAEDIAPNDPSSATALKAAAGTTYTLLNIFFKSSLQIQHRVLGGGGSNTRFANSTVEYEHE